jgi:hypothetical protein
MTRRNSCAGVRVAVDAWSHTRNLSPFLEAPGYWDPRVVRAPLSGGLDARRIRRAGVPPRAVSSGSPPGHSIDEREPACAGNDGNGRGRCIWQRIRSGVSNATNCWGCWPSRYRRATRQVRANFGPSDASPTINPAPEITQQHRSRPRQRSSILAEPVSRFQRCETFDRRFRAWRMPNGSSRWASFR